LYWLEVLLCIKYLENKLLVFNQAFRTLDSHEFYFVIPNVCEGSYKITVLCHISYFGRDDIPQSIISVYYED